MTNENELPMRALSIRQPWAWAVIHGGKRFENRTYAAVRNMGIDVKKLALSKKPSMKIETRPICIHCSSTMLADEYKDAADFMRINLALICPAPKDLVRGAIIGTANIVGVVSDSDNPWFMGPYALVLDDVHPIVPIHVKGALGLFQWRNMDRIDPPELLKWMWK